jgi:tetrachlorobenzoquinone reductase
VGEKYSVLLTDLESMLESFAKASAATPRDLVHVEYFAPRQMAALDGGYAVQLHRRGQEFAIPVQAGI